MGLRVHPVLGDLMEQETEVFYLILGCEGWVGSDAEECRAVMGIGFDDAMCKFSFIGFDTFIEFNGNSAWQSDQTSN